MKSQLDPLNNGTITLRSPHQLTLSGVRWSREPTDDEFREIDTLAQSVDRFHAWVDGDVAAEYVRREGHARPGMTVATLLSEYAMARGKQVDVVKHRYMVSLFYRHKQRSALSWSHHFIIWAAGIPGEHEALSWLKQAEAGQWSAAELRAQIRLRLRPSITSEPVIHGLFPQELQDAADWVSGRIEDIDQMPIDHASAILENAQPIVDYIDKLRARVAAPGKESINPS